MKWLEYRDSNVLVEISFESSTTSNTRENTLNNDSVCFRWMFVHINVEIQPVQQHRTGLRWGIITIIGIWQMVLDHMVFVSVDTHNQNIWFKTKDTMQTSMRSIALQLPIMSCNHLNFHFIHGDLYSWSRQHTT